MIMKVRDASGWLQRVCLVKPSESGNIKYIGIEEAADRASAGYGKRLKSGLNEKGVGGVTFLLNSWDKETKGPDTSTVLRMAIETAGDGKGAVAAVEKAIGKGFAYGAGGCGILFNDPNESWYMELSGHHWGTKGPIRDDIFSASNYYQVPEMAKYEAASAVFKEKTIGRQQRALFLLEGVKGEVTIPMMFRFSRDQKLPPDKAFQYDNRIVCNEGWETWSVSGNLIIPDSKYPDILSVAWFAINRPNISPYIPFYIGITELPKLFEHEGASETFNKLRTLVDENPKYRKLVARVWTNFEYQEVTETVNLERKIVSLVKAGDKGAAQVLLNNFLKSKCDEAISIVNQLIKKISSESDWTKIKK